MYVIEEKYMRDWKTICRKFAEKIGGTLKTADNLGCSVVLANGTIKLYGVEDMITVLSPFKEG